MNDIIALHRAEYSADPEKVVSAPGVVTLMGEYTEQSEGFVLPVAINRTMTVAVSPQTTLALVSTLVVMSTQSGGRSASS